MLDDSFLDDPEALARADLHGLLRGAAEAGARVRTAARHATESGLDGLQPEGRPRALLVAGPGPTASCAADLLAAATGGSVPVRLLPATGRTAAPPGLRWTLPGWAGPLDLLFVLTPDGTEPGLTALVEQAYRRGCTVVAVSPPGAPLTESVTGVHGLPVPITASPYEHAEPTLRPPGAPGALWALLTPLLTLTDRLGLSHTPPEAIAALADRLDRVAERCGPAIATYSNPAKSLATELADALPLLWSEGPVADAAARHFATVLAALPGRPALAAELPSALTAHAALLVGDLAGGADEDAFFRDRLEEPQGLRARVVLLREEEAGRDSAAAAARELAHAHGAALSELQPGEGSTTVEAAAELIATTDFAAVYLTLTPTP
ncbi:SIS domain-containing protein [Streptomyces sp. 549]|uniref:SIS domain-containing protein n=1 Tax=Streptomyces sp. 549 TaxID=3049076 RepID=UPI0024C21F3F|nr:SIS domain-containing protein [Streptomyces sp. 549]MDK1475720.1 SIS domain-containing protein [Streptomyces sp. 549]